MPWLKQEQYYYCVPASIQMWALFDNSQFRVSQTTIASYVHAVPPDGAPATNVAPGVNYYTATKDASLLNAFYTAQAQFDTMQSTSINNQRPSLPSSTSSMSSWSVAAAGMWMTSMTGMSGTP
jgi:hypothetical protein